MALPMVPVAPMRRMRMTVLRLHEVHFSVLVAQLQESTVASRQYLSIHRIRLAAEHQAGTILRGPELDIGATCRGSQAQQYGFRISRRTVLLRLRTSAGRPNVKLGATED